MVLRGMLPMCGHTSIPASSHPRPWPRPAGKVARTVPTAVAVPLQAVGTPPFSVNIAVVTDGQAGRERGHAAGHAEVVGSTGQPAPHMMCQPTRICAHDTKVG